MKKYKLQAAPTASAKEIKNQRAAKAKQIAVGIDAHLKGYQASRKVDNAPIGVVQNLRSEAEVEHYVEKQLELAEEVVVVYEAGPLGYSLYRKLTARGARWSVRPIARSSKRSGARTTKSTAGA